MVVRVGPTTDGGYGGPRSRSIDAQFKSKGGKEKYALEGLKPCKSEMFPSCRIFEIEQNVMQSIGLV